MIDSQTCLHEQESQQDINYLFIFYLYLVQRMLLCMNEGNSSAIKCCLTASKQYSGKELLTNKRALSCVTNLIDSLRSLQRNAQNAKIFLPTEEHTGRLSATVTYKTGINAVQRTSQYVTLL